MKTFVNFLKRIDIFGHPIGVNYRGDGAFNTVFGSFVTLITAILVLNYAQIEFMDMYSRDGQKETTRSIKVPRNSNKA